MPVTPSVDHRIISALTGQPATLLAQTVSVDAMGQLLIKDGLTGLHNRQYLERRAAIELEETVRLLQPLALLVMDLNDFKRINDTLGHAAGDQALMETANLIRQMLPDTGSAARTGGDEFVILLPGWTGRDAEGWALQLLERMQSANVSLPGNQHLRLSGSIGLSACHEDGETYAALFEAADQAMYFAKHHQEGCVIRFGSLSKGFHRPDVVRLGWMTPLVGRSDELANLQQLLLRGGRVICLIGEPGVGKSRLVAEAVEAVTAQGWSACTVHGSGSGTLGGIRALCRALHLHAADRLTEHERDLLIALAGPGRPGMKTAGSRSLDSYFQNCAELMTAIAKGRPLLIFCEDLHTWDEASLGFIRYLGSEPFSQNLALVITINPSEEPAIRRLVRELEMLAESGSNTRLLTPGPLTLPQTVMLIRAMLLGEIDPPVIQLLWRTSQGNPLALNSLVEQWILAGRLLLASGCWQLATPEAKSDQNNIGETLYTQLQAIEPNVKLLLEALAVSDRPWCTESICRLCGSTPAEVNRWLAAAQQQRFIRKIDDQFVFANGFTRKLIASKTGRLTKRTWNRLAATLLAESGDADPSLLARHWELAGELTQAVHWHVQAAEEAERLSAAAAAGHHFRQAAELASALSALPQETDSLWQRAGDAFTTAARYEEAIRCYQRSLAADATPERKAQLLGTISRSSLLAGQLQEAVHYLNQAMDALPAHATLVLQANLLRQKSLLLSLVDSHFQEAIRVGKKAAKIGSTLQDKNIEAGAFATIAQAYYRQGEYRLALRWLRRMQQLAGPADLKARYNRALFQNGSRRRLNLMQEVAEECSRQGIPEGLILTWRVMMSDLAALGRWTEATTIYERCCQLAWRTDAATAGRVMADWASQLLLRGETDEAMILANRCQACFSVSTGNQQSTELTTLQAAIYFHQGLVDKALSMIQSYAGERPPINYLMLELYLYGTECWISRGSAEEAERWLALSEKCGRGAGANAISDGWTARLRGRIAELRGQTEHALDWYVQARRPRTRPFDRIIAWLDEARLRHRLSPTEVNPPLRLAGKAFRLAAQLSYNQLAREAKDQVSLMRGM